MVVARHQQYFMDVIRSENVVRNIIRFGARRIDTGRQPYGTEEGGRVPILPGVLNCCIRLMANERRGSVDKHVRRIPSLDELRRFHDSSSEIITAQHQNTVCFLQSVVLHQGRGQ